MSSDPEIVTSRANPLFKRLRTLRVRGDGDGICLLEGPRLVEEALAAGVEVLETVVSPRAEARAQCRTLLALLQSRRVPVRRLHDDLVASLSEAETSQGFLALARRPTFEEDRIFDGMPLVVLAVGIQNPGNLGGLLRTAEAAGASGAYLADGCADPLSWKGLRGSMGSAFRLPHVSGHTAAAVLDRLDARQIPVFATAADGDTRYDEADLASPVALVFGAEGSGVPPAVAERARVRLRIPIAATVESLNVGVAAGLLLFEAARQRGFPTATRSR
jgi:TrmH family RNA methyltransferase